MSSTVSLDSALDIADNKSELFKSKLLPAGGAAGEFLKKTAAGDYEKAWASLTATDIPDLTLAKITDSGDAASKDVGTGSGDVAAGDDSRFPTSDEKAALAGSGTPSASSKYITEDSTKDITTKELLGHSGDVVISGTTLTFENGILKSVAV